MKKVLTIYQAKHCQIIESEEIHDHYSVVDFGEPCSGVLKHWGSKKELIKELESIIEDIKSI